MSPTREPNDVTTADGRVFHFLCAEPYKRKDGTGTAINIWHSACAKCGAPFTIKTPAAVADSKAFLSRHCDAHKMTRGEVVALMKARKTEIAKARRVEKLEKISAEVTARKASKAP